MPRLFSDVPKPENHLGLGSPYALGRLVDANVT